MNDTTAKSSEMCRYSMQVSSLVNVRDDNIFIRNTVDMREFRDDCTRRRINEITGHADPCRCYICNPNTGINT